MSNGHRCFTSIRKAYMCVLWVNFEELNLLHQGLRLMSSNMSLEENSPWCHKPSWNRPANSRPPSEAEHPLMGSRVYNSTEQ